MLNTALFRPKNFLLVGLMALIWAILAEHIYNTVIAPAQAVKAE